MKKADKIKLVYLLGISLMISLVGCVDTGVQNIPENFEFNSQFKIVNIASATNVQSVTMYNADESQAGTFQLAIGDEYPATGESYMTIPSGSKTFIIQYSSGPVDTIRLTLESERKIRLFIMNPDSSTTEIQKNDLRYTWQDKSSGRADHLFFADSAFVSFLNGTIDSTVASILAINGADTLEIEANVAGNEATAFMVPAPLNYTLSFISDNGITLSTVPLNATGMSRYNSVLYTNTAGAIQSRVYIDD